MPQKEVRQHPRPIHPRQDLQEGDDCEVGRSEKIILEMDQLGSENYTHNATKAEIDVYGGNWWIHSNVVNFDTVPTRHQPDFKKALSTMYRLKQAKDKKQHAKWLQSSSFSSWQYLVQRIGPIVPGGVLPRKLRQQRWSPMNVPLMWAAASDRESDPVLQWLGDRASQIQQPVSFHGGECSASQGVRLGFNSLRGVMRGWGIESPEGLSQWLRQHGFPATRPGNHIPARGQEHIFALGCTVDARVTLLVSVMITVEQSRTAGVPNPSHSGGPQTRTARGAAHVARRDMGAVGPSGCGRDLFDESPHAEELPLFLAWSIAGVFRNDIARTVQGEDSS